MAPHRFQHRTARGFSVLELLIVLVILSVALMLAGRLLLEAQSRMDLRLQQTLRPVGELARRQIEADLRLASGVQTGLYTGWSRDAMVLLGHPAGSVSYAKIDQELLRIQRVPDAEPPLRERLVLQGTTTFRWRLWGRHTVEVDLGYREPNRLRRLVSRPQDMVWTDRRLRLRVTFRGGGQRAW